MSKKKVQKKSSQQQKSHGANIVIQLNFSSFLNFFVDAISYLRSPRKSKCGDVMKSNTTLILLLIIAIILIPLPLYMCVLFMQDSYVAYSGNYYHFDEPGIITWKNVLAPLYLTNHENGVYDNVLIALANNAMPLTITSWYILY